MRGSFGLESANYYLIAMVVMTFVQPVMFGFGVYQKYRTRVQEYDADANAVRLGYGEELKATFRRMSSDELINVNPAPVIEALEYDHPGMANRIRAIDRGMKRE